MGNTFGQLFRVTTWGESHGGAVGAVVDGCPPGIEVSVEEIQTELDRRRPGQSKLVTQRKESDKVTILSGIFDGRTLGTPISMMVANEDARPKGYEDFADVFRPSHADYTYQAKYGIRDWRGGGRSSARETVGRVAAGAIARKVLRLYYGVEVLAWVKRVHHIECAIDPTTVLQDMVEASPTRCPDPEAAKLITTAIEQARSDGNSLGGVVECIARGVPVGWGEPVFDRLEADLGKALMSIPASKGFEIGAGFAGTYMTGAEQNDEFYTDEAGRVRTRTNNSGGIQGGISNGENIILRIAFKPAPTITRAQKTVNESGQEVTLKAKGRHDPCVLPRAVPVVEAMVTLTLLDHALRHKAQCGK